VIVLPKSAARGTPPVAAARHGPGSSAGAQRRWRLTAAFRPLSIAAVPLPALLFAGGAPWAWLQVRAEAEARLIRTCRC